MTILTGTQTAGCGFAIGGHTELVVMKEHLQYETLGNTLDDAAERAFDRSRACSVGISGGPSFNWLPKLAIQRLSISQGSFG